MQGVENSRAARTDYNYDPTTGQPVKDRTSLDMNDFLRLFAAQMANQDMTSPMDQAEMMNQLTQMATVSAMNTFSDITMQTYTGSMVGKEVTVADYDEKGNLIEVVGVVTGAGLYGGQNVIFVNEKGYALSQIMAVGRIPAKKEEPEEPTDPPEGGDGTPPPEGGDGTPPPVGGDET